MQIQPASIAAQQMLPVATTSGAATHKATKAETREKVHGVFAETMLNTMLKQVRKTSQRAKLFSGGRGEEVFGSQLDQALAEKMSKPMAKQMAAHSLAQLATLGRK